MTIGSSFYSYGLIAVNVLFDWFSWGVLFMFVIWLLLYYYWTSYFIRGVSTCLRISSFSSPLLTVVPYTALISCYYSPLSPIYSSNSSGLKPICDVIGGWNGPTPWIKLLVLLITLGSNDLRGLSLFFVWESYTLWLALNLLFWGNYGLTAIILIYLWFEFLRWYFYLFCI